MRSSLKISFFALLILFLAINLGSTGKYCCCAKDYKDKLTQAKLDTINNHPYYNKGERHDMCRMQSGRWAGKWP
jgi:hypothetical protein